MNSLIYYYFTQKFILIYKIYLIILTLKDTWSFLHPQTSQNGLLFKAYTSKKNFSKNKKKIVPLINENKNRQQVSNEKKTMYII